MRKALFFDFDGVILDSVNIKTEAFYEMFLPYGKEIAEKVVTHHLAHGGISRFEKFAFYYSEYLGIKINQDKINELSGEFSNIVFQKVLSAEFISGVLEFLEYYHKKYECYIVSGTPESELKNIVFERNMAHFFKGIYGSPDTKIKILEKLFYKQEIDISNSYFIGDASTDLEAAQHFNLKFILVKAPHNKNLEPQSDFVVDNFHSLLNKI